MSITKSIIFTYLLIFLRLSLLLAQDQNRIMLLDKTTNEPLPDVLVFINNKIYDVSDNEGFVNLYQTSGKTLFLKHGYKTALFRGLPVVYLEPVSDKGTSIRTASNVEIIDEVTIRDNYDARRHLLKLWQDSHNYSAEFDTVMVYYKFVIEIEISNTSQKELMQGIIRVPYTGYNKRSLYSLDAYYCIIDHYENNIENSVYQQLPPNLIKKVLNRNILFAGNSSSWRHMAGRRNIINNIFHNKDTVFFKSVRTHNTGQTDNYIGFVNNRLKFFLSRWVAEGDPISVPFNPHSVYSQFRVMDYSKKNEIIPQKIVKKEFIKLDNGIDAKYSLYLERIPDIENILTDFDILVSISHSNKEVVERIREQTGFELIFNN